jgi:hypothetical protein
MPYIDIIIIIIIIITFSTSNNTESLLQCGNHAHDNVIREIFFDVNYCSCVCSRAWCRGLSVVEIYVRKKSLKSIAANSEVDFLPVKFLRIDPLNSKKNSNNIFLINE